MLKPNKCIRNNVCNLYVTMYYLSILFYLVIVYWKVHNIYNTISNLGFSYLYNIYIMWVYVILYLCNFQFKRLYFLVMFGRTLYLQLTLTARVHGSRPKFRGSRKNTYHPITSANTFLNTTKMLNGIIKQIILNIK